MLAFGVAVAIFFAFQGGIHKEALSSPDKAIRIMRVLRLYTIYKAKRDLIVTEFEDIYKKGSVIIDKVII